MLMEGAWDLQAIVGGTTSTNPMTTTTTTMDDYSVSYFTTTSLMMNNNYINDQEQDRVANDLDILYHHPSCSDLYETSSSTTRAALKELEDELLCRPFSNSFQQPISSSNNVVPNFSLTSNSSSPFLGESSQQLQQLQQQQQQQQQEQQLQYPSLAALSTTTAATTTTTTKFSRAHSLPPRLKKRKIQPKRVVLHVPAEGLSSDMWAWRKYGQKPIKGSPYPRGYYRCSSSKGCMAKKLVERSFSDPAMFVITYKAEHNHPQPTHRNSLAGSTRNKVISATSTTPTTTPVSIASSSSMEENINKLMLQQPKEESREDNDFDDHFRSMDDLFMGLEMFTGPTSITTSDSAYSHLTF